MAVVVDAGWGDLVDELRLLILSFLPRETLPGLASVSREFHRLVYDDSLWKDVRLARWTAARVHSFLRRLGAGPRSLEIRQCRLPSSDLSELFASGARLEALSLIKNPEPLSGTEFARLDRLSALSLVGCKLSPGSLDKLCRTLPVSLTSLSLRLSIGDNPIALSRSVFRLQSLALDSAWKLTPAELSEIVAHHSGLVSLSLQRCTNGVTEETLSGALAQLTALASLDVSYCVQGTSAGLQALCAARAASLRNLVLGSCEFVDAAAVAGMASARLRLCGLTLFQVTDAEMPALLSSLGDCLRELSLSSVRELTDLTAMAIAAHCHGLRRLSLAGCAHLSGDAVATIASRCPLIEDLDVAQVMKITQAVFAAVVAALPGLRRLNVALCVNVSDASVALAARGLRALEALTLDTLPVSMDGLGPLIQLQSQSLTSLSLRRCARVDNAAVTAVLAGLPALTALDLFGVSITQELCDAVAAAHPFVNFAMHEAYAPSEFALANYTSTLEQVAAAGPAFRSVRSALEGVL